LALTAAQQDWLYDFRAHFLPS